VKCLEIGNVLGRVAIASVNQTESLRGRLESESGGVIVLAEVAKEYVPQPRMPEPPHGHGALIVRKVTVAFAYSHLQIVRIWPADQHFSVVVGFEDHGVRL
jgi:hypothetical protein